MDDASDAQEENPENNVNDQIQSGAFLHENDDRW